MASVAIQLGLTLNFSARLLTSGAQQGPCSLFSQILSQRYHLIRLTHYLRNHRHLNLHRNRSRQ